MNCICLQFSEKQGISTKQYAVCYYTVIGPVLVIFDSLRLTRRKSSSAILLRRGPRHQHVREWILKRLEPAQYLWLHWNYIHVWIYTGIETQQNANIYTTAKGERSLQKNIGRLNISHNVSLLAKASLLNKC